MCELQANILEQRLTVMADEVGVQRIGVDAVYLPNWSRYLEVGGDRFLRRVYSPRELDQAEGEPERLASRFAGKEAVLKVLGTGIEGIGLSAVEIACEESGRPRVLLRDGAVEAAKTLTLCAFEISLCHEQEYALAVATALIGRKGQ
ncbi:MAG: holo-acyl-carrier-protein synthase [Solirubrobacterales bacterium]|nr:holo-acyl-carrier-protein synthase [Solirubrobacterales bacterium]